MKFCKQHRENFRRVVEYVYYAAYDDGEHGEHKKDTEKKKEIRNIGTVTLLAFESVGIPGEKCSCDNSKSINIHKRINNLKKHD